MIPCNGPNGNDVLLHCLDDEYIAFLVPSPALGWVIKIGR